MAGYVVGGGAGTGASLPSDLMGGTFSEWKSKVQQCPSSNMENWQH